MLYLVSLMLFSLVAINNAQFNDCYPSLSWQSPYFFSGPLTGYQYGDFNVIAFGDFVGAHGDVEGRVLTCGAYSTIQGFSIGLGLNTNPDSAGYNYPSRPHALVVGLTPCGIEDPFLNETTATPICWKYGSLDPDGRRHEMLGPEEGYFYPIECQWPTECFPSYLSYRQNGNCDSSDLSCLADNCATALSFYTNFANPTPAETGSYATVNSGTRIFIKQVTADTNIQVTIKNSDWNNAYELIFLNFNLDNNFLTITIDQDDCNDTYIGHAGKLPGDQAKKVALIFPDYNGAQCEGDVLATASFQGGAIIAPSRTYTQSAGVNNRGLIVAKNTTIVQANLWNCGGARCVQDVDDLSCPDRCYEGRCNFLADSTATNVDFSGNGACTKLIPYLGARSNQQRYFYYEATCTGIVSVTTSGLTLGAISQVWTTDENECIGDAIECSQTDLVFPATEGQQFTIEIGSELAAAPLSGTVTATCQPGAVIPAGGLTCKERCNETIAITGNGDLTVDTDALYEGNVLCTINAFETCSGGSNCCGSNPIYLLYTATCTGTFDMQVIAAQSGSGLLALIETDSCAMAGACADEDAGLSIPVVAAETYKIRYWGNVLGNFTFAYSCTP